MVANKHNCCGVEMAYFHKILSKGTIYMQRYLNTRTFARFILY